MEQRNLWFWHFTYSSRHNKFPHLNWTVLPSHFQWWMFAVVCFHFHFSEEEKLWILWSTVRCQDKRHTRKMVNDKRWQKVNKMSSILSMDATFLWKKKNPRKLPFHRGTHTNFRYRWKKKAKNRKQRQNTMPCDVCVQWENVVRKLGFVFNCATVVWLVPLVLVNFNFYLCVPFRYGDDDENTNKSKNKHKLHVHDHDNILCTPNMGAHRRWRHIRTHTLTHQMPNDMCLICVAKNHKYRTNEQPDWCTFWKSMENHTLSAPDKHLMSITSCFCFVLFSIRFFLFLNLSFWCTVTALLRSSTPLDAQAWMNVNCEFISINGQFQHSSMLVFSIIRCLWVFVSSSFWIFWETEIRRGNAVVFHRN